MVHANLGDDICRVTVTNQAVTGLVSGYTKGSDGKTYLLIGNSQLLLSDVTGVRQPASSSTSLSSATDSLTSLYNSYTNSSASGSTSFSNWLNNLLS